jgi:peptidyl-tRNA hydrolase
MNHVIVVNQSLRPTIGKRDAQVAYAAIDAVLHAHPAQQHTWLQEGRPNIV